MPVKTSVPVGATTIAGWGATLVGALATLLVVALGTDSQTATTVATATFTIVSFAVTQIGRYSQAREHLKADRAAVFASSGSALTASRVGNVAPLEENKIAGGFGDEDPAELEEPDEQEAPFLLESSARPDPPDDPPPAIDPRAPRRRR